MVITPGEGFYFLAEKEMLVSAGMHHTSYYIFNQNNLYIKVLYIFLFNHLFILYTKLVCQANTQTPDLYVHYNLITISNPLH